jgi:succinylarginine dihydrolase
MPEINFDGLVGPTHQYAGLSSGNLASLAHAGERGNPRAAALEGLSKMRFVASLGVGQAVLPPQPRPDVGVLRRLGFSGTDANVLESALRRAPKLLLSVSSASAMWTANAATVAPSSDTPDGRVHLVVANLASMFHRSLEPDQTARTLRAVFADPDRFHVHDALPPHVELGDEGAANHSRLATSAGQSGAAGDRASIGALHLFGWGRSADTGAGPRVHPARQSREASAAVGRLLDVPDGRALFWQQSPEAIDAGAFHSDVLAVGNDNVLLIHERAFVDSERLVEALRSALGPDFVCVVARSDELPLSEAVRAYPFNSQLVTAPDGSMAVIAPRECEVVPSARRFLERVVAEDNPVRTIHYVDVNSSMKNGGGPACLRLRVVLTDAERAAIGARVFWDEALGAVLEDWVGRHYRDRLTLDDLGDGRFLDETRAALDELTQLLELGPIYDFQR